MKTKNLLLTLALLLTACTGLSAQTIFEVDGIKYQLISATPATVEVIANTPVYSGSVTIPTNVTQSGITYSVTGIGQRAFQSCIGLTSVTLPASLTSIGYNAFDGCSGLTSLTLPPSLTSIGERTFYNCRGLTSITLPASLTSIGERTFFNCIGLKDIYAFNPTPVNLTNGSNVFYNVDKTTCTLHVPAGAVTAYRAANQWQDFANIVGDATFVANGIKYGVTSANPAKVEVIANTPKYSGSVTVPANVTQSGITYSVTGIGASAFQSCSGLISITLPASITSIGQGVFWGCSGLTSLTLPASLTSIARAAFRDCSGLKDIYALNPTPVDLTSSLSVFYNVDKTTCTLHVPAGAVTAYRAANQWAEFTNIVGDATTGIADTKLHQRLAVYPNPATVSFTLKGLEKETAIQVYTLTGSVVLEKTVAPNEEINVTSWSKGVYVVKADGKTTKLVVK